MVHPLPQPHPPQNLRFPAEIDAHLSDAALEHTPITLSIEGQKIEGHLDYADGFGLITFIYHQGRVPRSGEEVRASYTFNGALWHFITRVVEQSSRGRWQLMRPRSVQANRIPA